MDALYTIAVDAMGGDNAPAEIAQGAVMALANPNIKVLLLGREPDVEKALAGQKYDAQRLSIIHAEEVIGTDEAPTAAIRQKKNSSMMAGLGLLKEGKAGAFVSAGSTGALLTGATVIVGRVKGIERPALGALLPNAKSFSFLLDCGANVDAKPSYLAQFAKMGAVYMESVMGMKNPTVGLVNIGVEKEKGNGLTKEAYSLLEKAGVSFIGNVEARDIPFGAADVLVCDAFTGNIILKYTEGYAKALLSMVKKELMATTLSKLGALLSKGAFDNLKRSFDYDDIGGAPFLGLNGLVVKAHGSSGARAIAGAIGQSVRFLENNFTEKLQSKLNIE